MRAPVLRTYLQTLREPLVPLARAHKIAFAVIALGIAASRFMALSLTLHDWDETLFASAVREYDVKPHHPHPPGYPVFIVFAKAARLFTATDFHALQTVATLASMLVFPLAFLLARELRLPVGLSMGAAALTAFMPNVWYYGGTGFSDVPALALILAASAFLLRGGRQPGAYVVGALLTALACGIRPHLLMVAATPALFGALALRRFTVFAGAWAGAAVMVVASYVGAAFFSADFPEGYLKELRHIEKHIANVDSYRNPHRTPLNELVARVFLFPCGGGRTKVGIVVLAAIALLHALWRRQVGVGLVVMMFLPMAILTWLMLDITALSRYAISYVPLHAFLAIAGLDAIASAARRARVAVFVGLAGFLIFSVAKWTAPALRFARTEPSPVVAAFQWIRTNVPKQGPRIFVQGGLVYHAYYFIPDYDFELVFDESKLVDDSFVVGNLLVLEGTTRHPDPQWFKRKRQQLWEVTRPRFFEIGIVPMHRVVRWGRGWYLLETDGGHSWRWMGKASETKLAPAVYGTGELRLRLHAPVDVTPRPSVITIVWNGRVIDRLTAPADGDFDLNYTLPSRTDRPNELRLSTDQVITPPGDGRTLGLSLQELTWKEPGGAAPAGPAVAALQ